MRPLALISLSLLLAAPVAAQSGAIDQSSPMATTLFNVDSPGLVWQQQVTAGTDGLLEGIRLEVRVSSPASVTIRIRPGIAWSNQPAIWSGTLSASGLGQTTWESVFVDCSSGGLVLAAGEEFVFELEGAIPGLLLRGNYCLIPGVPQYSDPLYLGQSPYSSCYRMGFDTYMLPATPSLSVIGSCPGSAQVTLERMTPGGPLDRFCGRLWESDCVQRSPAGRSLRARSCAGFRRGQLPADQPSRALGCRRVGFVRPAAEHA